MTYSKFILSLFLSTSIGVLSSCSSSKSDPGSKTQNPTPLPPGFEASADESIYDISNFELLEKDSPEYIKFSKEHLTYTYRRNVQEIKNLNGLENVEVLKMYYSFGTLVNQTRKQLSLSASDKNKWTESSYATSILINNESLLKNSNTLLSTIEAEVKEDNYNYDDKQNVYQTLNFNPDSYKQQYNNIEDIVNLNSYKKWTSLYEAEVAKYPFLNCNERKSSSDDNSFSMEYYKHKTIPNLYYTKTKSQGVTNCIDENNSYDIGRVIETNIQISYFAHESWFDKIIYYDSKTEYLDHNYTSRTVNKIFKKTY